ncbi:MAG: TolC family protein [Bacteroidia bacterium]
MKKILFKPLIWLLVSVCLDSNAQTLSELIKSALEKNYQLQIVKNEASIASNNNTIGNAGQLPTVDLNGTYTNSNNNTSQLFADGTLREGNNARNTNLNVNVMANWTVFNGFNIIAKRQQLEQLEKLGEINSKFYIEQTISDLVLLYHQLIYEKQLLNNFKQSMSISLFRLNLEAKRKQVGAGKAIDYGQALVDYQSDSILYLAQENRIQTLEVEMNAILNTALENRFDLNDLNFNYINIPLKDSVFQLIKSHNSALDQQRLNEILSEIDLRISRSQQYPKINVFAGMQYAKSTAEVGFQKSNQTYGPSFGVSISYALYNGSSVQREIKNADLSFQNSVTTQKQTEQNLDVEALNLINAYSSLQERIKLAQTNVNTIEQVNNAAKEQFKQGSINGYDFRLSQLTLLNAELTLLELKYSLKSAEINLNRLMGKVLESYL